MSRRQQSKSRRSLFAKCRACLDRWRTEYLDDRGLCPRCRNDWLTRRTAKQ